MWVQEDGEVLREGAEGVAVLTSPLSDALDLQLDNQQFYIGRHRCDCFNIQPVANLHLLVALIATRRCTLRQVFDLHPFKDHNRP